MNLSERLRRSMLLSEDGIGGGGVEAQETADPVTTDEPGAEDQKAADPGNATKKSDADAAFAQMRRDLEKAKKDLEASQAESKQFQDALGLFFQGDDIIAQARAQAEERSLEDVKAEMKAQTDLSNANSEIATLREQLAEKEAESRMASDLREIQAIDPKVKSLDELGENYAKFIESGLSGKMAYYAAKAMENEGKATAPTAIGRVQQSAEEKTSFTKAEVDKMTPAEISKNYDAIRKSMLTW